MGPHLPSMNFETYLFVISLIFAVFYTKFSSQIITIINSDWSFVNYFIVTISTLSAVIAYFIVIRFTFNFLKINLIGNNSYLTNYFYMFLAIMIISLLLGYFYISLLPESDRLKNFLIVFSVAIVNSFAVVSAMKSIPKIYSWFLPRGRVGRNN